MYTGFSIVWRSKTTSGRIGEIDLKAYLEAITPQVKNDAHGTLYSLQMPRTMFLGESVISTDNQIEPIKKEKNWWAQDS